MTSPGPLTAAELALVTAQVAAQLGPPSMGEGFPNPVAQLFQAGNTVEITPAGLFVYNGVAAAGNLIVSVAPAAGVDAFGNSFPAGLLVAAGAIAGTAITGSTFAGTDWLINAAGAFFYGGAPAAGNLLMALAQAAGTDGLTNNVPAGFLGQQLTLVNQAVAPAAFAGAGVYYSSIANRPRFLASSGSDSVLERSVVNVAQFPISAVAPAAPSNASAPMSYLASEGTQSSEYEIEVIGQLAWAAATPTGVTFFFYVDGAATVGAFTVAPGTVSHTVGYRFAFTLDILTATTALLSSGGQVWDQSANRSPADSVAVGSLSNAIAFDLTLNHTLQIMASWNTLTGGFTAGSGWITYRTRLARRM